MNKERAIKLVGRKASFADAAEEDADLLFWAEKTIRERMEDAFEREKKYGSIFMEVIH
jgi:hypothetical protein